MSALSKYLPSAPPAPPVLLARGDCFFTRRAPLAAGEPVADQIALALEGMAPFPPEQLYHGHLPSANGQSALVFAAFRRRFNAEETDAWAEAALVTAEFVPLLAARPKGDGVTLHTGESRVTALAWREGDDLPTIVLVRGGGPEIADSVAADALRRAALPAQAELVRIEGVLSLRPAGEGGYEAWAGEVLLGALPLGWAAGADVRDPDFLVERRRAQLRDLWLWRGLLGAAALLVLAATLDIGGGLLGMLKTRRERQVAEQTPQVDQLLAAQGLTNRIAELSEKRLLPFEMLALINPARPETIVFQNLVTRDQLGLQITGQAGSAEEVGVYAKALRELPALAKVEPRDVQSRNGVTTFVLSLDFKAEALRNGGAL